MTTILVVEDHPLNMKLARKLLTSAGYRVLGASDAESGLSVAREMHPDLILMDIQLPGMDGMEATRIIKSVPELRMIPVIALTALAMQGDEQRMLACGCDDYISKPLRPERLFEKVAAVLAHKTAEENIHDSEKT